MQYGKEIFNQMKTFRQSLWCWGASSFRVFEESTFKNLGNHSGGLFFKTRGYKHKGHVAVVYMQGKDLYRVHFGRFIKGEFSSKTQVDDVYCEDLEQVIDSHVEGTLK